MGWERRRPQHTLPVAFFSAAAPGFVWVPAWPGRRPKAPAAPNPVICSLSMQQPDPPPVVTVKLADLHDEIAAALDARLDGFERRLFKWIVAALVATAAITAAVLWLFAIQRLFTS